MSKVKSDGVVYLPLFVDRVKPIVPYLDDCEAGRLFKSLCEYTDNPNREPFPDNPLLAQSYRVIVKGFESVLAWKAHVSAVNSENARKRKPINPNAADIECDRKRPLATANDRSHQSNHLIEEGAAAPPSASRDADDFFEDF